MVDSDSYCDGRQGGSLRQGAATNVPDASWVQFKVGAGVVGIPNVILVKTKNAGTSKFTVTWSLEDANGQIPIPQGATPVQACRCAAPDTRM